MANHPLLHRQYYTTEKLKAMSKLMLKVSPPPLLWPAWQQSLTWPKPFSQYVSSPTFLKERSTVQQEKFSQLCVLCFLGLCWMDPLNKKTPPLWIIQTVTYCTHTWAQTHEVICLLPSFNCVLSRYLTGANSLGCRRCSDSGGHGSDVRLWAASSVSAVLLHHLLPAWKQSPAWLREIPPPHRAAGLT